MKSLLIALAVFVSFKDGRILEYKTGNVFKYQYKGWGTRDGVEIGTKITRTIDGTCYITYEDTVAYIPEDEHGGLLSASTEKPTVVK